MKEMLDRSFDIFCQEVGDVFETMTEKKLEGRNAVRVAMRGAKMVRDQITFEDFAQAIRSLESKQFMS